MEQCKSIINVFVADVFGQDALAFVPLGAGFVPLLQPDLLLQLAGVQSAAALVLQLGLRAVKPAAFGQDAPGRTLPVLALLLLLPVPVHGP